MERSASLPVTWLSGLGAGEDGDGIGHGALLGKRYRVVERIGGGGMGELYLATHLSRPGRFAVKVLRAALREDAAAVTQFAVEARMLGLLKHPNVVQLLDFDGDGACPFIAMEYLDGSDLARRLRERGPMPFDRVSRIVRQIAAALDLAHARRIVHGDIKPGNVVLVVDQRADVVKLVDFGIAWFLDQRPCAAEPAARASRPRMLGTPSFMAPEQAEGRCEEIDGRADQFALAALTYAMLTGMDPFPGNTTAEVLAQIVNGEPAPLNEYVNWRTDAVEAVLRRALSKRSADRYTGVLAFAAALQEAGQAPGGPSTSSPATGCGGGRSTCRLEISPGFPQARSRTALEHVRVEPGSMGWRTTVVAGR
jgi:serine/threonine protein kinase